MIREEGKDTRERGIWNPIEKRGWSTFSDVTGWKAETLEEKIKFLLTKCKVLGSMNKMINFLNLPYLE